jgi:regulator of sigma E protease
VWTAILAILLVANLLIFVHELGHLLAAKWAGMPVTCFSVGFGPGLLSKQVGRTRYRLALIPLGGYVRIEGMRGTEEERRAWPTGFAFQPLQARMVVIAAGCAANVILAGLLYAVLAFGGSGGPLEPRLLAVDASAVEDLVGWGTIPLDKRIVTIDDEPLEDWAAFGLALLSGAEGFHELGLDDGTSHRVWIPAEETSRVVILQALIPVMPPAVETDLRGALSLGAREVERNSRLIAESGRLLATGDISLRQLSGPVEIARIGGETLQFSPRGFLAFIAFLSLNLAILNFLPIPVLDGGHFFLLVLEGLKGSALPAPVYRYSTIAGATVVGFFMMFALLNDILRMLGI